MKVAVVYNRVSQRVINLFGVPNREKYGLKNIKRITDALKKGGHQVIALEGDKDLIDNLEDFMPRVVKGERPGMVFNLSYGIQGQARYTHVPGMLEMIGLPYVGSGPLAHSLALDKVVSKMIFVQHGVPTPDFAVLEEAGFEMPDLKFPLIVKPKNEAVSFGIQIVRSEKQLREAADVIFNEFQQPVLVEQYIAGREINVGILGNSPAEALPPAEIVFGKGGPQIYTYEDKTKKSGREIGVECPAKISEELKAKAQKIAQQAFHVLGCYDCCRVDMRLDSDDKLYVLEVNSLPSLGEHGSYVHGAAATGLDFPGLVNRLVEVAASRYFGTPSPPELNRAGGDPSAKVFGFLTERRDDLEREVGEWCRVRSVTNDPVGLQGAKEKLEESLTALRMEPVAELSDDPHCWTWQSTAGLKDGTLLVTHLDVPFEPQVSMQMFRREPEWLHGEGIASSRAPLVMLLFALRSLRHARRLAKTPLGVLAYCDEGRDARFSAATIREAAAEARNMLVLRPGFIGDKFVAARRGQRRYRLVAEGAPLWLGKPTKRTEVLRWMFAKLEACAKLTSRNDRVAVSTLDLKTAHMPMLLPHQVTATLLTNYPDETAADKLESDIRAILETKGIRWKLEQISDRPPMKEGRSDKRLAKELSAVATEWEIPLGRETSVWPSVAGLAPAGTGVVCGMGPVATNLYTPDEGVQRISLLQRTLLLSQFLCAQAK